MTEQKIYDRIEQMQKELQDIEKMQKELQEQVDKNDTDISHLEGELKKLSKKK